MNKQTDDEARWHLDKRVPIAIIFAFVLQTIYFTIFLTRLDSRVGVLEDKIIDISGSYREVVEVRIHQEYIIKEIDNLNAFLRDDVEWIKPKDYKGKK